ncbi:JAB domain-containing protein [Neobacillus vireti]|uniref:JAB domain-containing protein n=1 Tax=Neobacillus vireti TaxID=220686 RepID=UPI002FFDF8AF
MQQTQTIVENKQRMKRLKVVSLQITREKVFPYVTNRIRTPHDAVKLAQEFIGNEDREHFVVFCLSTRNTVDAIHTVSVGTLNSSLVHPREVFKASLLSNSCSIICAHNHPSSDCSPSKEDLEVTKRLAEAGKILGIELLDHVIVSNTEHYSMREHGHI